MAFCRGFITLLVLCVVSVSLAAEVPVYLWGDIGRSSIKHSALSSVPANEFRIILKQELFEEPFTVVFIEETLSVEDFSRKIDYDSSFPYLESKVGDAVYLPLVESPLKVLNKFADTDKADHVKLTDNGLSADVSTNDGQYLFINLKDAKEGESREELLRRHNDFMEDMVTKLQERYDKVAAIYTAHYPSWTVVEHSRVRRQAETQPNTGTPTVTSLNFAGLKMYFQNVLLFNGTADTILTGARGDPASAVNETMMASTLLFADDINATLNFEATNGGNYWFLRSVSLFAPGTTEQTLYPDADSLLFAYGGFSYRCAVNITLATREVANSTTSNNWALTFQNTRMQPFFMSNSSGLEFGDSLNCVGFFTAPIWAGIFVVAVMLSITFYGIMMMMDIRTMDRFDDPKGKTITINAVE